MGWKVLIVDDSGVMRKMIARALRQTGLDFDEHHEAGNGLEAENVEPIAILTPGVTPAPVAHHATGTQSNPAHVVQAVGLLVDAIDGRTAVRSLATF